jgi:hypothetical protein
VIRKPQEHEQAIRAIEATISLYFKTGKPNIVEISRDTSIKKSVIDWLCEEGILKLTERGQKNHHFTKYKVTDSPSLIENGLIYKKRDLVIVKDGNKNVLMPNQITNKRKLNTAQSDLAKINTHINKSDIALNGKPLLVSLYRIFKEPTLVHGGRFYDDYVWINSFERLNIEIDGETTVEVDFKSMYAALMYAEIGEQLTQDAYSVDGFDRNDVKAVFTRLVAINDDGLTGLNNYTFDMPNDKVLSITEAIKSKHPKIANRLLNPITCHELMHQESYLMNKILLASIKEGLVILPVHDCVICKRSDVEQVKELMDTVTTKRYGFTLPISVKDKREELMKNGFIKSTKKHKKKQDKTTTTTIYSN